MEKPAARLGDITAHGGVITTGFPMVLIGGKPAARIDDMHVCPMVNPGLPPPPHIGGPISKGSSMVLIGGKPAARRGDMVICAGPPDVIATGCSMVLIGESASGSSRGKSGRAGASESAEGFAISFIGAAIIEGTVAQVARKGAAIALSEDKASPSKTESPAREAHWIEFEFLDLAGNPVSGIPYNFITPDCKESESVLNSRGRIRWDGPNAGQGTVKLEYVTNARWSQQEANVGDTITLMADVYGYESGTPANFRIYKRDVRGSDKKVDTIETKTQGDKVNANWKYKFPEEINSSLSSKYSDPDFYFDIVVKTDKARSGILRYKSFVEIRFQDGRGQPVPYEPYIMYLSNGEVRKGKLDDNGYAREENVPPANHSVLFPNRSVVERVN